MIPAAGTALSDVPAGRLARLSWYGVVLAWAAEPHRWRLSTRARRRVGRFVSRHGVELARVAHERGHDDAGLVRELVDFALESGSHVPCGRTPVARYLADLDAWHEALWTYHATVESVAFPPPPPYEPEIGRLRVTALRSSDQLADEGKRMHHCARGMARACATGTLCVFHAEFDGERLTIAVRLRGAQWHLDEVAGIANRPPSLEARLAVIQWFARLRDASPAEQ